MCSCEHKLLVLYPMCFPKNCGHAEYATSNNLHRSQPVGLFPPPHMVEPVRREFNLLAGIARIDYFAVNRRILLVAGRPIMKRIALCVTLLCFWAAPS